MDNAPKKLIIDREFKSLIRPLRREEYLQLEESILEDGCRDPIITWNRVIIDGHNRYEICTRHEVPFRTIEKDFDCREAAIAWICKTQLGRRNISEEMRKFLIGMQYESEKIINKMKNPNGHNQYTLVEDYVAEAAKEGRDLRRPPVHITARRIADANHVSESTVQKYATFARTIGAIGKQAPSVVPQILSGRYKISHENLVELSQLTGKQIEDAFHKMEKTDKPYVRYSNTRQAIRQPQPIVELPSGPTVKDMPVFDPDAEMTGLALTVPSWSSSIDRATAHSNLEAVSSGAKANLAKVLLDLKKRIEELLLEIERQ